MRLHELKCWPCHFDAIVHGEKRFEVRRETDRVFAVGDLMLLKEWRPDTESYSGRTVLVEVTYGLRGANVPDGQLGVNSVILGFNFMRPIPPHRLGISA